MKRLAVIVLLVVAAAAFYRSLGSPETGTGSLTLPQPAPIAGDNAPRFTARSVGGEPFELSGKGLYVLAFWSTLNVSSNRALPAFEDLAEEYGDDGVSFAAVYANGAPREESVSFTMLQDPTGQLVSKYNVKRVPRLFVVRDGKVEFALDYYYEGYEKELREKLEEALAQRPEKDRSTALRED
ncbi:MAG: peroxiredoxin family protein [Actinomycetota bacterium]|nr:peroxiredoxin family protein [Actinomycetota bacterium]